MFAYTCIALFMCYWIQFFAIWIVYIFSILCCVKLDACVFPLYLFASLCIIETLTFFSNLEEIELPVHAACKGMADMTCNINIIVAYTEATNPRRHHATSPVILYVCIYFLLLDVTRGRARRSCTAHNEGSAARRRVTGLGTLLHSRSLHTILPLSVRCFYMYIYSLTFNFYRSSQTCFTTFPIRWTRRIVRVSSAGEWGSGGEGGSEVTRGVGLLGHLLR